MKKQNKELKLMCKMVYNTVNIPIVFIHKSKGEILIINNHSFVEHSTLPLVLIDQFFSVRNCNPIQLIYINQHHLKDTVVMLPNPECMDKLILLWPSVDDFLPCKKTLDQHFSHQLQIDVTQLFHTAILLHYLFYNETLSLNEVVKHNEHSKTTIIPEIIELNIMQQRENSSYHNSFLAEKKIWHSVQLGDTEKVLYYKNLHSQEGIYGKLSKKDTLRDSKNILISAIAIATRSAIEGGLYPEIAYNLSDSYIQYIEELATIPSVDKLMEQFLLDFTSRVKQANRSKYTKVVLLCQEYIFNHLYEELTLELLANQLNINPSYLSNKFKAETGETLIGFIQRQKIEEAKHLIVYSDLSISQIYAVLNFYDQSYFIKVFKKMTGLTPKQFKNNFIVQTLPSN
jgi:YesN/AraC family two-component response regulator